MTHVAAFLSGIDKEEDALLLDLMSDVVILFLVSLYVDAVVQESGYEQETSPCSFFHQS